jgi:transcriptional regulator with XRE-family HTH domain
MNMSIENDYHYGKTIRAYRKQRKMSSALLAERWPTGPIDASYIRKVESGRKVIGSVDVLRQLAEILDIPLEEFGLSSYNPFNPNTLPGQGMLLVEETLETVEMLIDNTWTLRSTSPLSKLVKNTDKLYQLCTRLQHYAYPGTQLEARFLRLMADMHAIRAVVKVEQKDNAGAIACYQDMYQCSQQLGDPGHIAHSLMNIGVEYERNDEKKEAVTYLERARDEALRANKAWLPLILSYLSRVYASDQQADAFERVSEQADTLSYHLAEEEPGDHICYNRSGVLAERSYGYITIGQPQKVIAMESEIREQIRLDHNIRLDMWIELDYANANRDLKDLEQGIHYCDQFLSKARTLQSDQAIDRAGRYAAGLFASHPEVQVVKDFHERLVTEHILQLA